MSLSSVNLGASALVDPKLAENQPGARKAGQITLGFKYQSLYGERIAERWYAWQVARN
ncbi:hypothetical protein [Pseudomonas argentinensis]|uniref:hypothetical protein n=1 Tax=Phytopseudomonas argentinensis TaxID=289370 RepID=UPI000AF5020E|nr:hypothetical protein [Pseudomonas argentinensis]